MERVLFTALIVLLSQSARPDSLSPIDKPITDDFRIANPRTLNPCSVGMVIDQIARKTRVMVGFENEPGCPPSPKATTRQLRHRESGDDGEEILTGMTARQAFDHVTDILKMFTWQDMHGIVVVRPKAAWEDRTNPLNVPAAPLTVANQKVSDILDTILRGARPPMFVPHHRVPGSERSTDGPVSVTFPGGTVLDALNTVVRARHNSEWQLGYVSQGTAMLIVGTLDFADGDTMAPVALPTTHR
jgi:hypothetical protein